MLTGAVGLRMRDVPIIANLTMAVLLIFCGVNVPLDKLPDWMHAIADGAAADACDRGRAPGRGRRVARQRQNADLVAELALGIALPRSPGFALLRWFEHRGPPARHTGPRMRRLRGSSRPASSINLKMLGDVERSSC